MLRAQRLQKEANDEQSAALDFRARIAVSHRVAEPENLPLGIVPDFHRPVVKLPRARRMEFRAHLIRMVLQAFEERLDQSGVEALGEELAEAVRSPSLFDTGAACATCQGFCCREGGNHAYLTASVIRSFLVRNPGLRWKEVVRVFLKLLPEESYAQSCVYHGPHGCGLTREMRSAACNRYCCEGLQQLQTRLDESGSPRALIIAAVGTKFARATLVSGAGKARRISVSPGAGVG